ncbi:MAG: hypothetical protein Salg2KO_01380 [Salibacteraceae bacterium]
MPYHCRVKVFVINLPGIEDRKSWMKLHLAERGLQFEFIDGIDGRKWSDEQIKRLVTPRLFNLYSSNKGWLTKGAIAVTKAVIENFYKRIIAGDIDYAVFMEDDVVLSDSFVDDLKEIESRLKAKKAEGIFLMHYMLKQPTRLKELKSIKLSGNHTAYKMKPGQKVGSGAGFIASKGAAEQMIANHTPIDAIADWWTDHKNLDVHIVYPPMLNSGKFTSTLGYTKSPWLRVMSKIGFLNSIIEHARLRRSKRATFKNVIE